MDVLVVWSVRTHIMLYPSLLPLHVDCTCDGRGVFTCGSCECLAKYHQCDGVVDCADGSDEQGCSKFGDFVLRFLLTYS